MQAAGLPEALEVWCLGPLHCRRQAGEDGSDVTASLQAEDRAAIVKQVELDVAATADKLFVTVGFSPVCVEIAADERVVDRQERAADFLREGEIGLPAPFFLRRMLPVEKNAADAT